jgi:hypothetical protein
MDRFNRLKNIQQEIMKLKNKYQEVQDKETKQKIKEEVITLKDVETQHLYDMLSELTKEKLDLLEDVKMLNLEASKHYEKMKEYEEILIKHNLLNQEVKKENN